MGTIDYNSDLTYSYLKNKTKDELIDIIFHLHKSCQIFKEKIKDSESNRIKFIEKIQNQVEVSPVIQELINKHFWELI